MYSNYPCRIFFHGYSPSGEKRLIAGSVLKESYIILQHQSNITPLQIVIKEGVATGLFITDFIQNPLHKISIFAAISTDNLTHVALVMKQQYPDSNIIVGDNDVNQNHLTNKVIPHLTNNHIVLWKCIRNRTQENDSRTKACIHNNLCAIGLDVDKKFSRWLSKLVYAGVIFVEDDIVKVDTEIQ